MGLEETAVRSEDDHPEESAFDVTRNRVGRLLQNAEENRLQLLQVLEKVLLPEVPSEVSTEMAAVADSRSSLRTWAEDEVCGRLEEFNDRMRDLIERVDL